MYQLDSEIWFPDPYKYHPESEIVAVGGDLSAQRLILAYSLGGVRGSMKVMRFSGGVQILGLYFSQKS